MNVHVLRVYVYAYLYVLYVYLRTCSKCNMRTPASSPEAATRDASSAARLGRAQEGEAGCQRRPRQTPDDGHPKGPFRCMYVRKYIYTYHIYIHT